MELMTMLREAFKCYGNALQAAASNGNQAIVQLLLANGADVNAQGGLYTNALYAAASKGNEAIVQLLLTNGADVNAQADNYGNALHEALYPKEMKLLSSFF
ncbi:ankyrin [Gymnopus androsaceus JB14]|uniref:Ankyrin n=1 Tax=Gymnopus androsaceus JB14 TaxID=1447944 RepID=A0A6A4GV10_9AGAR|nr:ankyrin [Gymnopus androsaceus JB14]